MNCLCQAGCCIDLRVKSLAMVYVRPPAKRCSTEFCYLRPDFCELYVMIHAATIHSCNFFRKFPNSLLFREIFSHFPPIALVPLIQTIFHPPKVTNHSTSREEKRWESHFTFHTREHFSTLRAIVVGRFQGSWSRGFRENYWQLASNTLHRLQPGRFH